MSYLDFLPNADRRAIKALLEEKAQWLAQSQKGVERFRLPYESVQHIRAGQCDFSGDVVKIGSPDELPGRDGEKVYKAMRDFMPWRKGPFEVFGIEIDAE